MTPCTVLAGAHSPLVRTSSRLYTVSLSSMVIFRIYPFSCTVAHASSQRTTSASIGITSRVRSVANSSFPGGIALEQMLPWIRLNEDSRRLFSSSRHHHMVRYVQPEVPIGELGEYQIMEPSGRKDFSKLLARVPCRLPPPFDENFRNPVLPSHYC